MQRETYAEFSDTTYNTFNSLMGMSRELNTHIDPPEYVFIGPNNSGKTSLIESYLGHTFTRGKPTKRPVQINMLCNPSCADPKLILRRDAFLSNKGQEYDHDFEITLDMVGNEIQKRNSSTAVPIFLQYEFKNTFNIILIDTPPIPDSTLGITSTTNPDAEEEPKKDQTKEDKEAAAKKKQKKDQKYVQNLTKLLTPANRTIVCVEEAGKHTESMEDFIKQFDPKLERTIWVHNKLSDHLVTLQTSSDVNRYLTSLQANSFALTLPVLQKNTEGKYSKAAEFRTKLKEVNQDDMKRLESFSFDRKYGKQFGYANFRNHIIQSSWKHFQERMPIVLENLQNKLKQLQDDISVVMEQLQSMEPSRIRTTATNYAMSFLQNLEKLIKGTLEGIPNQNGQTLQDELDEDESGAWVDVEYKPVKVEADWNIPYSENKLYGKQQFERLLSQFHAVAEHIEMGPISHDDIACASGPNKTTTYSGFAWSASDLAQRRSRKIMLPLVNQLYEKSMYILKRLVNVVDKMMSTSKKATAKRQNTTASSTKTPREESFLDFPYYTNAVKELYFSFVEQTARSCLDKCKDDFYCTQIVYWDMVNFSSHQFPKESFNLEIYEQQEEVIELSKIIFKDVQKRITLNILLKFHSNFFMPIQNDLWGAVQGKVTSLDDEALVELFQVQANKSTLMQRRNTLTETQKKYGTLEEKFRVETSRFSHPK
eukprot:TRINITY_DN21785_c0_g1_i1.p1 TRINITY_DN21785_c0_g1~~TRINITY_DN21785_c0_g1_i1.p1  ORF type:complete len:709 (-),score=160.49 TRINITY_DN21785_c0_g1_i1:159-2285(-)